MNTFGARLRSLRKQKDLSQEQVAKYLGYSRVQVSNWEIERSEPDIQALGRLAEFYGVTVDDITGNVGTAASPVPVQKQTPADTTVGENIGEVARDNAMAFISAAAGIIELTDILKIENKLTYMGVPMAEDDIIRTRHVIEMVVMHSKLPKIIPIYPPRPPRDYSKIAKIEDIDPDQVPLPAEFMYKDQRITRYVLQAEGRIPTDDDWKEIVRNYKFNPPE